MSTVFDGFEKQLPATLNDIVRDIDKKIASGAMSAFAIYPDSEHSLIARWLTVEADRRLEGDSPR